MSQTRDLTSEKRAQHSHLSHYDQEQRLPDFKRCICLVWKDILCIAMTAGTLLALHQLPILFPQYRLMPYWIITDGSGVRYLQVPREYSYPIQREILGDALCGVIVTLGPLAVLTLLQIFVRCVWDWYTACSGLIKAVLASEMLPVVLKHFSGGFRPFYVDACKPNMTLLTERYHGAGTNGGYHSSASFFGLDVCTGDIKIYEDAMQSFPSGHTASAFAAGIFLALYLNGKLKVFADHSTHFWTFCAVIAPILGASLIAATQYVSHRHHGHDVIFGTIIGILFGILAFRSSYAAVFDYRFTHIPLPPKSAHTQLEYDDPLINEADSLVMWRWWRCQDSRMSVKHNRRLQSLHRGKTNSWQGPNTDEENNTYDGAYDIPRLPSFEPQEPLDLAARHCAEPANESKAQPGGSFDSVRSLVRNVFNSPRPALKLKNWPRDSWELARSRLGDTAAALEDSDVVYEAPPHEQPIRLRPSVGAHMDGSQESAQYSGHPGHRQHGYYASGHSSRKESRTC